MTQVLLGQAYFLRFDPKLWDAMQPYAPLGTLYAAARLRQGGHPVALFDAMLADSEADWDASLARERPRFAVIYEDSFNYLSKMCLLRMREAAIRMLGMARRRGAIPIVAGSDATDHPELYLDAGAEWVVTGEGEETLLELLDRLTERVPGPPGAVSGLVGRDASGELLRTPARPFIRELDALPLPARDLVDVERYRRIWKRRHGYFSLNLVTTRGCPYHCNWCAKPIYGQRYAVRGPEAVAAEVAELAGRYRPDQLSFVDDIFGLKPGWVEAFADALDASGVRLPFTCLSRVDLLSEPVVAALRRARCRRVWVGAESGSQRVLDAMEKGTRVEQIHDAARRLHEAEIEVGFFLQFGYPGETREDVEATLQLVAACDPDDIGISVSYPLPGTRFHERVRDQLGDQHNWHDSQDLAMLYRGPYASGFYRTLHRVVHKEFRLRRFRRDGGSAGEVGWPRRLRRGAAAAWAAATLPLERRRLEREARRPHVGVAPLPPELSLDQAARPSEREP